MLPVVTKTSCLRSSQVSGRASTLRAIQGGLSDRFRIVCTVGAGCGLRQGEILGLSLDDIDEDGENLHVQRQIRVVDRALVFALPKDGKKRRVPLSSGVLAATRAQERVYPSTEVTLPWGESGGKPVTVRLLLTGEGGRLYTGDCFHKVVWQGAFRTAGVGYRKRADGMHALRHFYASTLLAQGVSIKELAEYLGHSDPGSRCGRTPTLCRPATSGLGWRSMACLVSIRLTAWTRPDHGNQRSGHRHQDC